jgi:hypothetical protein
MPPIPVSSLDEAISLAGAPRRPLTVVHDYAPPSARAVFWEQFREPLSRWAPISQLSASRPPSEQGFSRANAALALLDDALDRLGSRKGPRENAARKALEGQRRKIQDAIDAVHAIAGADFAGADYAGAKFTPGPLGHELIAQSEAVQARALTAEAAHRDATVGTVGLALQALEVSRIERRDLGVALDAALASLAFPPLPIAATFERARIETEALESLPGKAPRARDVHRAIAEGLSTPADVALLHVVFESDSFHELIQWRARAASENK